MPDKIDELLNIAQRDSFRYRARGLPFELGELEAMLERYVVDRTHPGDFLMAVLCNDLREAFGRADTRNIDRMFNIVQFCYNVLPAGSWGSPEKVQAWLNRED